MGRRPKHALRNKIPRIWHLDLNLGSVHASLKRLKVIPFRSLQHGLMNFVKDILTYRPFFFQIVIRSGKTIPSLNKACASECSMMKTLLLRLLCWILAMSIGKVSNTKFTIWTLFKTWVMTFLTVLSVILFSFRKAIKTITVSIQLIIVIVTTVTLTHFMIIMSLTK